MRKFLITSAKYPGAVEMLFNQNDTLVRIDFLNACLSPGQVKHMLSIAPVHFSQFNEKFKGTSADIVEATFEITFDMFWDKYDLKRNKKPAEKIWLRLSSADKTKALMSVDAYNRYIKKNSGWYNKMYPDTYLRNEHFNDEWDKLNR